MKPVMILGGAGSIGSEVARRLVRDGQAVKVLDCDEERLWELKCEMGNDIACIPGDIRQIGQWKAINVAMTECGHVVNCAARKHVDFCEQNPELSDSINTGAAAIVAEICARKGINYLYVSTDKAIQPTCAMGRSKARGEEAAKRWGHNVVRFGNVLGTRGSLVPAIKRYAALGRPIPITDPDMTRWFMPITEAVDLIIDSIYSNKRGVTFHPGCPKSARIGDFVQVCAELFAPLMPILTVGPRPGERTHEFMYVGATLVESSDPKFLLDRHGIVALMEQSRCLEPVA